MNGSLSVPMPVLGWRERLGAVASELRLDGGLVALFVASRVLIVVAAFVAEALLPRNPLARTRRRRPDPPQPHQLGRLVLPRHRPGRLPGRSRERGVFQRRLSAALSVRRPAAFWPIPGSDGIVAILVSNLAFIAALALARCASGHPTWVADGRRSPRACWSSTRSRPCSPWRTARRPVPAADGRRVPCRGARTSRVGGHLRRIDGAVPGPGRRAPPAPAHRHAPPGRMATAGVAGLAAARIPSRASRSLATWRRSPVPRAAFLDAQQAWGREGIGGAPAGGTIGAMFSPYQAALHP